MAVSARTRYLAALFTGPLPRVDAVVLLAGEDAEARLATAVEVMRQGAAFTLLIVGGVDDGDGVWGAERLEREALSKGVAPDRICTDPHAMNTHEQALDTIAVARSCEWKSMLLVASPYHMPRAFRTFVQVLYDKDATDLRVIPLPSNGPWTFCPPGSAYTRRELMAREARKAWWYGLRGHVASCAMATAYLDGLEHAP